MPVAVHASDAEGCADLKPLPRLEACVIVECSAKQHDSFDAPDASGAPSDANTNTLSYSCPVDRPPEDGARVRHPASQSGLSEHYSGQERPGEPGVDRPQGRAMDPLERE